tara:strand:- start:925 stop:1368 length:444 start_codon:yes stop_codon:yes gene_type:complete
MSVLKYNEKVLEELIKKQKEKIPLTHKLTYADIKRLSKNIDTSIFGEECAIWKGFINIKNNNKKYVNFYFRRKKIAINRILYINYKDNLSPSDYLCYTCSNQGTCCNINHISIKNKNKNKNKIKHIKEDPPTKRSKIIKDKQIIFDG